MSDLTEFLTARLDEDEQAAQAATPGPWEASKAYRVNVVDTVGKIIGRGADYGTTTDAAGESFNSVNAVHIARWDPARALAEVEAKRRIIELHAESWDELGGDDLVSTGCEVCKPHAVFRHDRGWGEEYPCRTLRLLALPYADHPDFRPEWGSTDVGVAL